MPFADRRSPLKGIGLKVAAVTIFIAMAACIKAAAPHVPPGEAVFARSFFAMPVIFVWLMLRHDFPGGLRTANPWGHAWRGLIGTSAMLMGFAALGLLPLPQVTAIGYAVPVLVVVLAALSLGEPVRLFRMSAVAMGLVGVGIVLWPDLVASGLDAGTARTVGALLALGSAVLAAVAQVLIRRLVETEDTPAIVFYFSLSASLTGLATWPLGLMGAWVWPSAREAALLVGAGILGGFGQIALTSAYRYADASTIAPFEYSSILLAVAIGYVAFAEVPSAWTITGAAVVIAAGILIIWRESRLGLRRGKGRRLMTPQG